MLKAPWHLLKARLWMSDLTPGASERQLLEERLRRVKDDLEDLARIAPELRDHSRWQALVEEEARLLQRLADLPESAGSDEPSTE